MNRTLFLAGAAALALAPLPALAKPDAGPAAAPLPTPQAVLGHMMGENHYVPSYEDMLRYWRALAARSDRIRLIDIGQTTQGRHQIMAVVSSPENLARLDHYREISRQLGTAEGIDAAAARQLAGEGRALVWVDGGLHAAEVEAQTALIQQSYDLVAAEDAEARRIRDQVITLLVPDNPDGQQFVADWYMRIADPDKREPDLTSLPRLYHPYIGHDNNRDFYMAEMVETRNMADVLYKSWRPQIIFNQHQTGPSGTVVFLPPFRDPFNYHYEPLVISSLDEVGAALQSRLLAEGKPGATTRSGAHYDTWYNGNLRTSAYFHNAIGLLVEIIGSPVPERIPFVPERQVPGNDLPAPVAPQMWTMAQSIAYSVSLERAVLAYAAGNREKLLYNRWQMGADAIARGNTDQWTISTDRIAAAHAAAAAAGEAPRPTRTTGSSEIGKAYYDSVLHDPAQRDPRAFIVPVAQHDFPTAARFLTALTRLGVDVRRARAPFQAAGRSWPAGTYIVPAAQAYRAHVLDMFEPQHYPNNFQYPGGPPIPPADASGYTPAFQMGVEFARALDGFAADSVPVAGEIAPDPVPVAGAVAHPAGWLVSHAQNNSFLLVNRLLKAHVAVAEMRASLPVAGGPAAPGAIWVPAGGAAGGIVAEGARSLGIVAEALATAPSGPRIALKPQRVALVDLYGGLHPTGWLRWIFDGYELPYRIVYPRQLDAGHLKRAFDVVILPDAAIPNARTGGAGGMFRGRFENAQPKPADIPAQYRPSLGAISAERTLPALAGFVTQGGVLVAMGSSSAGLARAMDLPVSDPLSEAPSGSGADGRPQPLPRSRFYIPGALLTATADQQDPIAWGLAAQPDLFFDASPVFRLKPGTPGASVPLAFGAGPLLHSGWAWHAEYLAGTGAVVSLPRGRGRVVLVGPEIALRGQTQGAFKILFNAITLPAAAGKEP